MSEAKKGGGGAPKGNRNAARLGQDLKFEMFLSKTRRNMLEEYCLFKFRHLPPEEELRAIAREIAYAAIDQECIRTLTRPDRELMVELRLSETTTTLFTEYYRLKFGREPTTQELQARAQELFDTTLRQEMVREFEQHQPRGGYAEVF